jgi:hypothetical protein
MKKIVLLAGLAALAACSQKAPEAPAATDTAMAEATPAAADASAASMAVDGKPDAGTYEVTGPDGKVFKQTLTADGKITNVIDGKTVSGTWTRKGTSTYCITMDGETAAKCYTDTMDGTTWHSTNDADPKDVATIVRTS